jgi:hypothetical protein
MWKVKAGPAESAKGIGERGRSPEPDQHLPEVSVVAKASGTHEVSAEDEKTNFFTGSERQTISIAVSRDPLGSEPRCHGALSDS